tara:strand:- start:802 stop:1260 length:459 start_codon:yes stop_codon:yes gene_type:complete
MVQKTTSKPSPIKIIKLINGDDIVCALPAEQLGDKSPMLRLSKPLLVKYVPQFTPGGGLKDYVALIKWSPYTKDIIITIPKDKIMSIVNANMDMTKSYDYVVKTYDKTVPITKKQTTATYQRERFSDEDNEKVNEIFDELDDDDFIPKKTIH